MTTTTFSPTSSAVFGFQATLDGVLYSVTVPWNVSRQDWYVQVRGAQGGLVLNVPRVGSPPPPQNGVNLVGGYFLTTAMYYYPDSGTFVVVPPITFGNSEAGGASGVHDMMSIYTRTPPIGTTHHGVFTLDSSILGGPDLLA